jgi:hypothetical protein
MRINYDLSELGAAARERIEEILIRENILHLLNKVTLSVDKSDEVKVDEIIAVTESIEEFFETTQSEARNVRSGIVGRVCELCGIRPAAPLSLRRQVGMVIVMRQYEVDAVLCSPCAERSYVDFQKQTAIKGWTGVRSALMNPVMLSANLVNIRRHREQINQLRRSAQ